MPHKHIGFEIIRNPFLKIRAFFIKRKILKRYKQWGIKAPREIIIGFF